MLRALYAFALGFAVLSAAGAAHAIPAIFAAEGTITTAFNSTIPTGGTLRIEVAIDNGGASLLNQTWGLSDVTEVDVVHIPSGGSPTKIIDDFPIPGGSDFFTLTTDSFGTVIHISLDLGPQIQYSGLVPSPRLPRSGRLFCDCERAYRHRL